MLLEILKQNHYSIISLTQTGHLLFPHSHRLPSLCLLLSCQRLPSQDYLLLEDCVLCLKLWGHIHRLLHSQGYQECQDSESKTNSQANLVCLLPPTLGDPHQGIYTPSIPLSMLGILHTSLCKVPKMSAETI